MTNEKKTSFLADCNKLFNKSAHKVSTLFNGLMPRKAKFEIERFRGKILRRSTHYDDDIYL